MKYRQFVVWVLLMIFVLSCGAIAEDVPSTQDRMLSVLITNVQWEGKDIYLDYTATVKGDGVYLLGFEQPQLSGQTGDHLWTSYIEDALYYAIGGEWGNTRSGRLTLMTEAEQDLAKDYILTLKAWLLAPSVPIVPIDEEEFESQMSETNAVGFSGDAISGDDILYAVRADDSDYYSHEGFVELYRYELVQNYLGEHTDWGNWEPDKWMEEDPPEDYKPDIRMIDELGLGTIADSIQTDYQIPAGTKFAKPVTKLAENEFAFDDYELRVTSFALTHFKLSIEFEIIPDDFSEVDMSRNDVNYPPLGRYYHLYSTDGKPLDLPEDSRSWCAFDNGDTTDRLIVVYNIRRDFTSLDSPLVLTPYVTGEDSKQTDYLEESFVLQPMIN